MNHIPLKESYSSTAFFPPLFFLHLDFTDTVEKLVSPIELAVFLKI